MGINKNNYRYFEITSNKNKKKDIQVGKKKPKQYLCGIKIIQFK